MRKKGVHEQISIDENDILISTRERPIWQKALAAILFMGTGFCLYLFFVKFDLNADSQMAHFYGSILEIGGFLFVTGVRFSMVKDYYFDLNEKRYKIVRRVGFFEFGKWKDFKNLGYVSVFKNAKDVLEINLWYNENRHFNLGQGENLQIALDAGRRIAEKLKIDLLDAATKPHESQWVPLTEAV